MSAGGMDDRGALSRAVITDGSGKTLEAMPAGTEVWTAMMSEYNTSYEGNDWAFPSGARAHMLYCATYGKANAPVDGKAPVDFGSNVRYWDDAHARSSIITIRALAVPGVPIKDGGGAWVWRWKTAESGGEVPLSAWGNDPANAPTTAYWALSTNQTDDTFKKEDLCFSNNLADNRGKGNADARLMFREDTRKFDAGNMVFYHALTKFTIKIKCGDGFNGDGTDFHFTGSPTGKDNSFALKGFYGKGVFDLTAGEFQSLTAADITTFTSIYLAKTTPQKKEAGDYYTLQAYVLPGTDIKNGDNVADAFSFDIDKNHYKISMYDLYNAIFNKKDGMGNWVNRGDGGTGVKTSVLGGGKTLLAGVNYQFTFTVEKTKIKDITAQVIDWESVQADNMTPSNARINIMLEERGTAVTAGVSFYRTRDPGNNDVSDHYVGYEWHKGYTTDGMATAAYDNGKGKWAVTGWYWPDNTTYYHFRALGNMTHTAPDSLPAPVADVPYGPDYFSLKKHGESYEDYIWGAPFLDDADNETAGSFQWSYSLTKGFDGTDAEDGKTPQKHQIYHGIGPTNSVIKILMFHVMSDVTFSVKTTAGENKVTLKDGGNHTKIWLKNLYTSGKVLMGNGLVTPTGGPTAKYDFSNPVENGGSYSWNGYAVPQGLTNVVLVITTPDKNEYRVAMKDVLATTVSTYNIKNPYALNGSGKYMIDRWYPGFKYKYSFTLTKKGIENITATVVDWEEVTADDDIVQIQ